MSDSAPLDDVKAEQSSVAADKRPFPKHWIALWILVVANAAFGAYFNPMGRDESEVGERTAYAMIGFLLTQPILFALWAAFAPQRFYHRFLWAFLLCSIVSFAEELGTLGYTQSGLGDTMVFQLILFLLFTAILLLVRRFIGWHFKIAQMEISPGYYQSYQFGIKHLILLTTFAAIAFALIRSLFILNSNNNEMPAVAETIGIACIFFAMIIPIIFIPWYALTSHRKIAWLLLITILSLGIIDLTVYLILIKRAPASDNNEIEFIVFFQLGACLSVLFNTIVLRYCGYRLTRERKSTSTSQALCQ
jgi:hypothetical protein